MASKPAADVPGGGGQQESKTVLYIAVAGFIAMGLLYYLYGQVEDGPKVQLSRERGDSVIVIVAARDLYQGIPIADEDLFAIEIPPDYLPKVVVGAGEDNEGEEIYAPVFDTPERVVGRYPRERILANELIRAERLADPSSGEGLNALIPRGMRGISVNLRGAGALQGFLRPGNYVDILVTIDRDDGLPPQTETLLQAVFVLGVDSRLSYEEDDDVSARGKQKPSVTFLVTSEQAEQVAYAEEMGEIALALRNPQDVKVNLLDGVDVADLIAKFRPPPPPRPIYRAPPPPDTTVERSGNTITFITGRTQHSEFVETYTTKEAVEAP